MGQELEADYEEIVAGINRGFRAKLFLNRDLVSAGWRFVDDVIVNKRCRVQGLDRCCQGDHFLPIRILKTRKEQTIGWTQQLAAAVDHFQDSFSHWRIVGGNLFFN